MANQSKPMARNVALYPWFRFFHTAIFWQAIWFLYFQERLSASEAVLLYAIYDIATTALEVPSGWMSDRLGRRLTLIASASLGVAGSLLLAFGESLALFASGQILVGASAALASGTDSALLYESLSESSRENEVEVQELRAWRFSFTALAISAVAGGLMYLWSAALPFLASAAAYAAMLLVAFRFTEPSQHRADLPQGGELVRLGTLRAALTEPVLVWLFGLSLLMYVFSHVPFVFGQPFILEALAAAGYEGEAPLVSGVVSATMMVLSVAASWVALGLRRKIGLTAIVLLAFAMQIGLAGVLAVTNDAIAIIFLFLRMVPDALSRPFIVARIQPMLSRESRATYLSIQSFAGRILFALTLVAVSQTTSETGGMPYDDIQKVLTWYVFVGVAALGALALTARRLPIESGQP